MPRFGIYGFNERRKTEVRIAGQSNRSCLWPTPVHQSAIHAGIEKIWICRLHSVFLRLVQAHNRKHQTIRAMKRWLLVLLFSGWMPIVRRYQTEHPPYPHDDIGFSDLGCCGEIQTPNSTLARNGLRFTQFCNTSAAPHAPRSSRACIRTRAGAHDGGSRARGYRSNLNRNCVTLAEVMPAPATGRMRQLRDQPRHCGRRQQQLAGAAGVREVRHDSRHFRPRVALPAEHSSRR